MLNKHVITHYGVKGMRWGVRKAGGAAKTFLTGDPSTSVLHPKGRAAAIAGGKAAVSKISNNKVFKAVVFNKDYTLLTKKGRTGIVKQFKKNAAARYAKAEKTAAGKKAAAQKRAKDTKKLMDQMIAHDKASKESWGKKWTKKDQADAEHVFTTLFKNELTVQDEY